MSIYIKGMDMPTNCTDCRYRPLVGCNPYQDNGLSPSDHRHRTCPLTEVAEPVGDLISRADAIDAIDDAIDANSPQWAILRTKIGFLPSAETTGALDDAIAKYVADGLMELPTDGDLIRREDAVNAICKHSCYTEYGLCSNVGFPRTACGYVEAIQLLPSAEAVSREDYHNLLMASNDIDRALREYQDKDENQSADAVSFEDAMQIRNTILYKEYMRGRRDAEAVQGEWILVKGSNGKYYHKCSKCLHTQEITGVKNYCAVCGARMKGGDYK